MDMTAALRRRIARVNNDKTAEIIFSMVDPERGGAVGFRLKSRGFVQARIPDTCLKALRTGAKSENLDQHLRP